MIEKENVYLNREKTCYINMDTKIITSDKAVKTMSPMRGCLLCYLIENEGKLCKYRDLNKVVGNYQSVISNVPEDKLYITDKMKQLYKDLRAHDIQLSFKTEDIGKADMVFINSPGDDGGYILFLPQRKKKGDASEILHDEIGDPNRKMIKEISLRIAHKNKLDYLHNASEVLLPYICDYEEWLGNLTSTSILEGIEILWRQEEWNGLFVGKTGSGKTTASIWAMDNLVKCYSNLCAFFVNVEEYVQSECIDIFDYIYEYGVKSCSIIAKEKYLMMMDAICNSTRNEYPGIIIIIDGLSNCQTEYVWKLQKDIDALRMYENLQLIATTNTEYHPFVMGKISVQRMDVLELTEDQIKGYLENHNHKENVSVDYSLLRNPLVLTIYANTNKYLQLNNPKNLNFIRREIKSEADILWNMVELYAVRNSEKYKNNVEALKAVFIFRIVLPYIAYDMIVKNTKEISLREVCDLFDTSVEVFNKTEFVDVFDEYFGYEQEIFFSKQECRGILERLFIGQTGIMKKNQSGKYSFSNNSYYFFFAAIYIYRWMIVCNVSRRTTNILEMSIFPYETNRYVEELAGEFVNRPYYNESDKKWKSENINTEIIKALGYYRNKFDCSSKRAVSNLINMLKIARGNDLSGVDLSCLDLTRSTFSHVKCCSDDGELVAKFDGTKIDRWIFGSVGFCDDLGEIVEAKKYNYLICSIGNNVEILNSDTHQIVKVIEFNSHVQSICISSDQKTMMVSAVKGGLYEVKLETLETTSVFTMSDLFHKVKYLFNNIVVLVTRSKHLIIYDCDKNCVLSKISTNANGVISLNGGYIAVPSRAREIFELELSSSNVVKTYELGSDADSYISSLEYIEQEDVLIAATKDGKILEWKRGEKNSFKKYDLGKMINDFAFNQDKSVIFCATQEGDILRVDRGTEEIKIIYIDKEEVWNGILFFEDQLIFSSVEGTICCGNADKFEFSKIQNKQFEYTIPYLCMKDCTFLNLNAESEIDSKLKSELRKNGIQI